MRPQASTGNRPTYAPRMPHVGQFVCFCLLSLQLFPRRRRPQARQHGSGGKDGACLRMPPATATTKQQNTHGNDNEGDRPRIGKLIHERGSYIQRGGGILGRIKVLPLSNDIEAGNPTLQKPRRAVVLFQPQGNRGMDATR